jgi:hydrogenase maturation factor HypF (carbamoyltransferase family)
LIEKDLLKVNNKAEEINDLIQTLNKYKPIKYKLQKSIINGYQFDIPTKFEIIKILGTGMFFG